MQRVPKQNSRRLNKYVCPLQILWLCRKALGFPSMVLILAMVTERSADGTCSPGHTLELSTYRYSDNYESFNLQYRTPCRERECLSLFPQNYAYVGHTHVWHWHLLQPDFLMYYFCSMQCL
uniref:Uncharacterized protein n=1 Tax=Hordeum vulgare subsp. vulgare TaxID=112509 RepID=A0A8I7BI47_HORVV